MSESSAEPPTSEYCAKLSYLYSVFTLFVFICYYYYRTLTACFSCNFKFLIYSLNSIYVDSQEVCNPCPFPIHLRLCSATLHKSFPSLAPPHYDYGNYTPRSHVYSAIRINGPIKDKEGRSKEARGCCYCSATAATFKSIKGNKGNEQQEEEQVNDITFLLLAFLCMVCISST